SPIVTDGAVYALGNRGDLYAFDVQAIDDAPPLVTEAVLDITGKDKYRFLYGLEVGGPDSPAGYFADSLTVPGLPPIRLTFKVLDEGSGVNPSSVDLTLSGQKLETLYDPVGSQVWYILDPERGPAKPLPNGALNFVLKLRDWVGNQAVAQVSFTVDNALPPLEHKGAGGMMGGEGGMPGMGMPGMGMPGMGMPGMGMPGMP
ncbi:MAG: hypothetical protein FJX74_16875, partial [Armatimonadetes bacterium]|nr:hypothetical protein [Armatimonadota bacterium]